MTINISAVVVTSILFLMAYAWISLIARVIRGNEILALEPRRETPWGWIAVVLSFVLLIGSQIVAGLTFGAPPDAEPTAAQTGALLTWTMVAILAATLMSIGLIHVLARAGRHDFGISLEHVPRDVFTGIHAFLILGPVTFSIQFVFVYLFEIESHHPLIELLKQDSSGTLFGVVTLLAVVVAPISEEYFFRVLLQGWLERFFLFRIEHHREAEFLARKAEFLARFDSASLSTDDVQGSTEFESDSEMNPYSAPQHFPAADQDSTAAIVPTASSIPILISAAVFALLHWSHGPDPAALFVLALGLGYLYQRTHRWLPSVVTHACLNGTTMLLLWFGLDELPR